MKNSPLSSINLRSIIQNVSEEQEEQFNTELNGTVDSIVKSIMENNNPFVVNKKYMVFTITMIYIGKVIEKTPYFVKLDTAAWIPNLGKVSESVKSIKSLKSAERFIKPVWLNVASIITFTEYDQDLNDLPRE